MEKKDQKIKKIKKIIQNEVLVAKDTGETFNHSINKKDTWLFDFRNIFLQPQHIDLIADIFWEKFKDQYPFQVGGLETAAIPFVSAIVMKSVQHNKPVNGFFIRKSRKKQGLRQLLEGKVTDHKIILVDDLINNGNSFLRQIKVLEELGKEVHAFFTIVHFRDLDVYTFAQEKNSTITSLFSLYDFGFTPLNKKNKKMPENNFTVEWGFKSSNPNYYYSVPKSAPVLDDDKIYFGSDSGNFWALKQNNGAVVWKYKVGWQAKGKSIFSSPALYKNVVYFGSYDGNVYALDTESGKKKWVFREADWIGSSPAIAPKLNLLFIGLEFGLWKKRGGVAALDLATGEKKWEYILPEFTHSSPLYIPEKNVVAIGSNDSIVYLFNAKKGRRLWQIKTGGDIKESFAYDKKRNTLIFGSHDGILYIVNISSGKIVYTFETKDAINSTPLVFGDNVYFSSLDKRLYSLNLETNTLNWSYNTNGRMFASPRMINGYIYVGSNDGKLYEIDPETGEAVGFFQTTERITNEVAYNKKTDRFFVPTFANEIYCISKKER